MSENKTGKYLKYGIGEILLVMIGILLALQVNNWNEEQKKVQVEINTIIDIKSDIQENIQNLEKGIAHLEITAQNTLVVLDYYQQKKSYSNIDQEIFKDFFGIWDPDFTYAAFENLKNQGVNLVSNKSLRKSLIKLHEVDMNILDVSEVSRINLIHESMILPILKKYFYRKKNPENNEWELVVSDYDNMINDPEFYSTLTEIAHRQDRSIKRFRIFNIKAREIISQINKELNILGYD